MGQRAAHRVIIAALFLRGLHGPSLHSRAWPAVLDTLCRFDPPLPHAAPALRDAGHWEAASLLTQPGRLDAALRASFLCVADDDYPVRWLSALGSAAPPALWRDPSPLPAAPPVSVVGSRALAPPARRIATSAGAALASFGRTLVSGGASGADSLAMSAFLDAAPGSGVVILPCGLHRAPLVPGAVRLSLAPADTPFSASLAMERNALIYAASSHTLVVAARLRAGGTWGGAVDALRRRLSLLLVPDADDPASRALLALGAHPLPPGPVADALRQGLAITPPLAQPALFGHDRVRETPTPYITPA